MTALQRDAIDLVQRMPEDKLYFIIQIMQGIDGLSQTDRERKKRKQAAFEELERLRRCVPDLDEERELEEWREEKYGNAYHA
ncbi:MAG: UDP-N-acetylenolpyruvoylglucosamine reductase [Clostridia bacterium]|nr:UDP-N-acetylenolpyruvoylglucosamine reductase [Clostridia bacterium]